MPESFDPWLYLDHLRRRGRFIGLVCAVALATSLAGSLLMTKKYTATSRIIIEPPAGSDVRAAMTVSPIYLESLKTYELLAASDDLFYQAAEHFHLRDREHPNAIDRLKRSVLKVTIPRNTKVLEISATLPDPQKAHALALYLAAETVKLNRSIEAEGDRELASEAEKQLAEAQSRLQEAQSAWSAANQTQRPMEARSARRDAEARVNMAWEAVDAAEKHLREVRSAAGYRGERLKIVDPGVVPERASSPNVPLNMIAACMIALFASLACVTLEFSYKLRKPAAVRPALRVAAKARED